MRVFEITRASDSKVVHADDVGRLHELLAQVFDVADTPSVHVTVSGMEMDPQEYSDNHTDDSWDE